jgi:hypothetical protein
MSKILILFICSLLICCTTKNGTNQQTKSVKTPKQVTEIKKSPPSKPEIQKEPKIIDNYLLDFYGEISVSSFLRARWGDLKDRDSLNYEDVAKYFRYEHPEEIRSLELHSFDTNQFVFFSPYIMDYQPSIEYFTKDSLVHSKSERYYNSFQYLSDSIKKKYTLFMRTQIHKNNQFLAAFEKSTKQGILFIYRKHDHYFNKVNINCFIIDNFSDGYAQENNNFRALLKTQI